MDKETARQEIRRNWRELILGVTTTAKTKKNGEQSYICPFCEHGKGGDGLTFNPKSRDKNGLYCFSCKFSGDIIDLYMQYNHAGYHETFSLLAEKLGLTIDADTPQDAQKRQQSSAKQAANTNTPAEQENATAGTQDAPQQADFSAYYEQCRAHINDAAAAEYLQSRGIDAAAAARFCLGYDTKARRIVIPQTKGFYVARAISPSAQKRYDNPKGVPVAIYNAAALYSDAQAVFVCEGAFDAISVMLAGGTAIALNGTGQAGQLITMLERKRPKARLILCLDKDDAGARAAAGLEKALQEKQISFSTGKISGAYKDAAEYFAADRANFTANIRYTEKQLVSSRPDSETYYLRGRFRADADSFKSVVKTGYPNLDKETGGLYVGLYVLAAGTSLGKTTFALQMACQIAAAGTDVLFFALEQSHFELTSKNIARTIAEQNPAHLLHRGAGITSLDIRKGYKGDEPTAAARAEVAKYLPAALAEYDRTAAKHLNIISKNFTCDFAFIADYIRRYMKENHTKPVVFVDYLQILQPGRDEYGRKKTAKEAIDDTISALKKLSVEQDIAIIAISSVNRANYLTPVNFESLKESGNIEYTADVVWGLQLQCVNTNELFEKDTKNVGKRKELDKAKKEYPRKIELVCLKSRFCSPYYSCFYDYYQANDLYVDGTEPPKPQTFEEMGIPVKFKTEQNN